MTPHTTREQWLRTAVTALGPVFGAQGAALPPVAVSVGFPGGGAKRKAIGQCWAPSTTADHLPAVFVSPVLDDVEGPCGVLATLVHELVHASVGTECGHKGPFRTLALALGLAGKMTATVAGPELLALLGALALELGPYPHARIDLTSRPKQGTRLVKVACTQGCETEGKPYVVRMTRLHLDNLGAPVCPGCREHMEEV